MPSHGQVAAKVRSYKELHPSEYCPVKGCLWRIADREGNPISICRKHLVSQEVEEVLKFTVTIQPIEGSEVSYKVGGFDRGDARSQGVERWLLEDDHRSMLHIADVFVEPLVEQTEANLESRLLGRTG